MVYKVTILEDEASPLDNESRDCFWHSNTFNELAPPKDDVVYTNRFGLSVMSENTYQKLRDGEYEYCRKQRESKEAVNEEKR